RTTGLTKHFGPVKALDGLDLQVTKGEVFGFLGPNGAGKSTTIRILLDLIRPTAGTAEVLGRRPDDLGPRSRARIGYLPGELRMPDRSTAGQYLRYLARLRGGRGLDHIDRLAERFDLDQSKAIGKLSKGNKQKVGVIQAFMHDPELLILDEPTSGLDPLLQHEFQDLARERCHTGATVFMSSHVLSEIEDIAERVAIIRSGRLVDIDDLKTLRRRAGQLVELRFAETVPIDAFSPISNISDLTIEPDSRNGGSVLTCVLRGEPDRLLKAAADHRVVGWNAADRELEDLFLDFYRETTAGDQPPFDGRELTDENSDERILNRA
ncbi:MAG: ABC transporter ATP-binding protein, partial [Acidimicrobiales bacterium]